MKTIAAESKIWVYQSSQILSPEEEQQALVRLEDFVSSWKAHGRDLKAHFEVRESLFVILAVDENHAEASGCSIDGSVHFMQALGRHLGVDFFDRMTFAYRDDRGVCSLVHASLMRELYDKGELSDDTLFYDTLVTTYGELDKQWLKPLKTSWHYRFVS